MPKAKKRSDDFKKVKLKIGKTLKKPTETNTSFKAGKVVLLEQLKSGGTGNVNIPSTKRNQTLPDLLRHLRHYNANMRKDGVNGLKELLNGNRDLIRANLSVLIENLGPLLSDTDVDILKSNFTLWEIVFSTTDSSILTPHLSLLTAHLKCALTHLNPDVKRWSLKTLDLLIKCHSDLLRSSVSFDLINCFLDTLPQPQTSTSGSGGTTSRTLMTKNAKYELLIVAKNILSLFGTSPNSLEGNILRNHDTSAKIVNCTSMSGITSVSLCATEWSHSDLFNYDNYVHPRSSTSNEFDRFLIYFNKIVPFCHAFWIETTSVEGQSASIDCFTFDLESLMIMNDILHIYNIVIGFPVDLMITDTDIDDISWNLFRVTVRKTMTNSFLERYINLLPCRRGPRKSGEEALLSKYASPLDIGASVNLGLCRFLTYISTIMENQFSRLIHIIYDFLLNFLSDKKKDWRSILGGLQLVRDMRKLFTNCDHLDETSVDTYYRRLGEILSSSLLARGGHYKIKLEIISWLCDDLENSLITSWPNFDEIIKELPNLFSFMLDETTRGDNAGNKSTLIPIVINLLYRLTRFLILQRGNSWSLFVDRMVESNLLRLLLSNIEYLQADVKREAVNLLFYAAPVDESVVKVIDEMKQKLKSD